jgi:hypothetical protein
VTFTATAADAITYKFIRNGVGTMVSTPFRMNLYVIASAAVAVKVTYPLPSP